jgi:hypothetical protein
MTVRSAFFAYPSQPPELGATITAAIRAHREETGADGILAWSEDQIAGKFIASSVTDQIECRDVLAADVTRLNFNVMYEIGFALGKGKRLLLVKNAAFSESSPPIAEVGILDTLGYQSYENSSQLSSILKGFDATALVRALPALNHQAPLFLTQARFKTDSVTRIISRIKKARLFFRSFDPAESPRLSGPDAFRQVAESYGVLVHLLPAHYADAIVNNLRIAFLAGLAAGLGRITLILQEGWDPVPLDYRDLVSSFRHPEEIDAAIASFAEEVTEALQTSLVADSSAARSKLEEVSFFASAAENELKDLAEYYIQTDAYQRASRGEVRLVVGRKGSGKTAVFAQVRDQVRRSRQNIVLDLMPEGYKLRKFKETVLASLGEGSQEHVLTAFWEYLLLLEICHKILEKDRKAHTYDRRLVEPYQRLRQLYETDEYVSEGDFSERMTVLLGRIAEDYEVMVARDSNAIPQAKVTELLYKHDVAALRDAVCEYLRFKAELRLLFDNIDKGWPTHGLQASDLRIIRALLEATRKLEQHLLRKGIVCRTLVFLRNDVFERLVDETPDRGKEARAGLDWTDADMLRELVRRRLVFSGMPDEPFDQLWRQIFISHVDGEETSQYLIDRCLMRPRGLIDLLNHCKSFAVNLRHEKVLAGDIEKGLRAFSNDLLIDVGYEIRDVMPTAGDVLYAFIDAPTRLTEEQLGERLGEASIEESERQAVIELLLWYGVLGLVGEPEHGAVFIYSVNYEMAVLKTLLGRARRGSDREIYCLNPAFVTALSTHS